MKRLEYLVGYNPIKTKADFDFAVTLFVGLFPFFLACIK